MSVLFIYIEDRGYRTSARAACEPNTLDDGTPLNYTRRKVEGRKKKDERISLLNSSFRLPTFPIRPRRAMEQIVDYKNDPGNGYTKTLRSALGFPPFNIRNSAFDISRIHHLAA